MTMISILQDLRYGSRMPRSSISKKVAVLEGANDGNVEAGPAICPS